MTSVRSALSIVIVGSAITVLSAQNPVPGTATPGQPTPTSRTPPRATRPGDNPMKGTAVLRGWVVAADTGAPLRRAVVRAFSQDGRNGGQTTTDAQGRFEIPDLVGGRFSLSVSKAGYVTMSYGQRRAGQPGTTLEVLDGQLVEKIAFSLPRGGVITGKVTDEFGDPIAGAQVNALRYTYMNGRQQLMPNGGASTDDLGSFRIYGLIPGDYYVSGSLRVQMFAQPGMNTTAVEGFAQSYFPGTTNASEAQRITVRVGAETTGINFGLVAARLARITGVAVSSNGQPIAQGMASMSNVDRSAMGMFMPGSMTRGDGGFEFLGVPPGTYHLTVRPRGNVDTDSEFALLKITVGSDDIHNLVLTASRGGIARGVIVTDEGVPLPVRPQQVNVGARPVEPEMMPMGGGPSVVKDDWTFEVPGLYDRRVIFASVMEGDWALKAVYHNDLDITDQPLDFVPGQTLEGLQVVFTRKRTDLSGLVSDERSRPVTDATIIIFSEDPKRWTYLSRYMRTARPSQDGRYSLRGMPPHDYLVVAVREIEPGRWQDPEFLESMRDQAKRVALAEGETRVQDLKVARN